MRLIFCLQTVVGLSFSSVDGPVNPDNTLLLPVYAFYGRNKQMLYLVMAIIIVGQSIGIAWIIVVVPKFRAAPLPVPHNLPLGACIVLQADPRFPEYLSVIGIQ